MTLKLSSRHEWVRKSELRAMSVECERVGGVNLSQGVCDLAVPEPVARAAKAAIDAGHNSYSRHDGTRALRYALAEKYQRRAGLDVDPESNIVVSAGATGALYCACLALLEPGDEVILFEPYYSYHESTLIATEAKPVFVPTQAPDWSFSMDALERAVTKRTRAIIVNTPSNPSGKVWTRAELERIAEFSQRHDLFVFTDEIYEHFIFDDLEHVSAASLPGMWERTITISGLSKTFSITGWRIGYAICDQRWAGAIGNFSDLIYVCAPTPLQVGAAAGVVELDDAYFEKLAAKYRQKRELLCDALDEAGLTPHVPQGAYYVLADVSQLPGANSRDRAMYLLETTGVASVPGRSFFKGPEGETIVRFCFAKEDAVIEDACRRLASLRSRAGNAA
ncbi:MAG: pyridoxal phosphate-dependent aminotransferase [Gammaproteobacteria bacterium]|nr:pyridoxal phosphate-dependent aminotransferase [Gammaproteobacteria bacterium]MDH5345199.1 pyridoxal phosphate-dependent aminotransferase [Gammaproteobacteria bacterium]